MRSSRLVVLSLAAIGAAGLMPSVGAAQSATQGFADSWYWGAYGGYTSFATAFGAGTRELDERPFAVQHLDRDAGLPRMLCQ